MAKISHVETLVPWWQSHPWWSQDPKVFQKTAGGSWWLPLVTPILIYDHIYIYMCICICICRYIYIYVCIYLYIWSQPKKHHPTWKKAPSGDSYPYKHIVKRQRRSEVVIIIIYPYMIILTYPVHISYTSAWLPVSHQVFQAIAFFSSTI